MRISDWSSDVCSSDLLSGFHRPGYGHRYCAGPAADDFRSVQAGRRHGQPAIWGNWPGPVHFPRIGAAIGWQDHGRKRTRRSEEHTSELQSLMRISYAVFCLKKKNSLHILIYKVNTILT